MSYATDLGATTPAVPDGEAAESLGGALARVNAQVEACVCIPGGDCSAAEIVHALATPQFVGLYPVALRVPTNLPSYNGDAVLVFRVGGVYAPDARFALLSQQ